MAQVPGQTDLRGDGFARADVKAPDVQHYAEQENIHMNPQVVDVHTAGAASQAASGWFASTFIDIESERRLLDVTYYGIIAAAVAVYVTLHFLPSAYGRYASRAFGILIPARLAWFAQDLPAVVMPLLVFFKLEHTQLHLVNYILLGLFLISYTQRALIYPALIKGGKPVPSGPFLAAIAYNCINGYFQSRYLIRFAYYAPMEVISIHFLAGLLMFGIGIWINWQSDSILRGLRSPLSKGSVEVEASSAETVAQVYDKEFGPTATAAGPGGPMPSNRLSASRTPVGNSGGAGYKIPYGGMFEFVSCANFFGEIVEWWGFAMASWSLPALAHAIFTTANLVPRALQHHQDYLNKYREDYPKDRAAVIPYIL